MAAFYIDHNVTVQLAYLLRAGGHDVVTARDLGLDHAGDDEHLLTAAQQSRIFISHNRADFVLLHNAWRRWSTTWQVAARHAGILILPQPLAAAQLAFEVENFQRAGLSLDNGLYEWRASSGWIRR